MSLIITNSSAHKMMTMKVYHGYQMAQSRLITNLLPQNRIATFSLISRDHWLKRAAPTLWIWKLVPNILPISLIIFTRIKKKVPPNKNMFMEKIMIRSLCSTIWFSIILQDLRPEEMKEQSILSKLVQLKIWSHGVHLQLLLLHLLPPCTEKTKKDFL